MVFGDRTSEFVTIAQSLRNKGLKPVAKRKETVYTARMKINQLAAEIGKDTHATAQKLSVLTRRTPTKRDHFFLHVYFIKSTISCFLSRGAVFNLSILILQVFYYHIISESIDKFLTYGMFLAFQ